MSNPSPTYQNGPTNGQSHRNVGGVTRARDDAIRAVCTDLVRSANRGAAPIPGRDEQGSNDLFNHLRRVAGGAVHAARIVSALDPYTKTSRSHRARARRRRSVDDAAHSDSGDSDDTSRTDSEAVGDDDLHRENSEAAVTEVQTDGAATAAAAATGATAARFRSRSPTQALYGVLPAPTFVGASDYVAPRYGTTPNIGRFAAMAGPSGWHRAIRRAAHQHRWLHTQLRLSLASLNPTAAWLGASGARHHGDTPLGPPPVETSPSYTAKLFSGEAGGWHRTLVAVHSVLILATGAGAYAVPWILSAAALSGTLFVDNTVGLDILTEAQPRSTPFVAAALVITVCAAVFAVCLAAVTLGVLCRSVTSTIERELQATGFDTFVPPTDRPWAEEKVAFGKPMQPPKVLRGVRLAVRKVREAALASITPAIAASAAARECVVLFLLWTATVVTLFVVHPLGGVIVFIHAAVCATTAPLSLDILGRRGRKTEDAWAKLVDETAQTQSAALAAANAAVLATSGHSQMSNSPQTALAHYPSFRLASPLIGSLTGIGKVGVFASSDKYTVHRHGQGPAKITAACGSGSDAAVDVMAVLRAHRVSRRTDAMRYAVVEQLHGLWIGAGALAAAAWAMSFIVGGQAIGDAPAESHAGHTFGQTWLLGWGHAPGDYNCASADDPFRIAQQRAHVTLVVALAILAAATLHRIVDRLSALSHGGGADHVLMRSVCTAIVQHLAPPAAQRAILLDRAAAADAESSSRDAGNGSGRRSRRNRRRATWPCSSRCYSPALLPAHSQESTAIKGSSAASPKPAPAQRPLR
jgi:hypothetical protein